MLTFRMILATSSKNISKIIAIILSVTTIFILLILQNLYISHYYSSEVQNVDNLIQKSPVNLTQIKEISKFRACGEGSSDGINILGEKETNRLLKHEFHVIEEVDGSDDTVEIFAPFDSKVISTENREAPDEILSLKSTNSNWIFEIYNANISERIKTGSVVKGGDFIGYANLKNNTYFDFALLYSQPKSLIVKLKEKMQRPHPEVYFKSDTMFNYLSANVENEFIQFGIQPDEMVISKEMRDSNPCPKSKSKKDETDQTVTYRNDWMQVISKLNTPRR